MIVNEVCKVTNRSKYEETQILCSVISWMICENQHSCVGKQRYFKFEEEHRDEAGWILHRWETYDVRVFDLIYKLHSVACWFDTRVQYPRRKWRCNFRDYLVWMQPSLIQLVCSNTSCTADFANISCVSYYSYSYSDTIRHNLKSRKESIPEPQINNIQEANSWTC